MAITNSSSVFSSNSVQAISSREYLNDRFLNRARSNSSFDRAIVDSAIQLIRPAREHTTLEVDDVVQLSPEAQNLLAANDEENPAQNAIEPVPTPIAPLAYNSFGALALADGVTNYGAMIAGAQAVSVNPYYRRRLDEF